MLVETSILLKLTAIRNRELNLLVSSNGHILIRYRLKVSDFRN